MTNVEKVVADTTDNAPRCAECTERMTWNDDLVAYVCIPCEDEEIEHMLAQEATQAHHAATHCANCDRPRTVCDGAACGFVYPAEAPADTRPNGPTVEIDWSRWDDEIPSLG